MTRASLCAGALFGGLALARYTDIAREDVTLGVTRAHASATTAPARPADPLGLSAVAHDQAAQVAAALEQALQAEAEAEEPVPEPLKTAFADHDGFASELKNGRIIRGATPNRMILFTFDDGPDRATTPKLLDKLDAAGVRAVFFLTGSNLRGTNVAERKNQKIARETIARGHWVASHGMNHRQLPLLSDAEVTIEVVEVEQVFQRVLGQRPWLIRPPGGAHSARVDRLLANRGYTTVLWNLGAGDFQVNKAEDVHATWRAVMERREAQGERGGIILLHDTYAWSVDAFQLIVNDLLARNCELLAKGEELFDFVDDPALFFQVREAGNPSGEASPAVMPTELLAKRQARLREETAQRCGAMASR